MGPPIVSGPTRSIAMYVAAPLSGNAVAERETEEASADETCGE
jgi:hypothetical protein